MRPITHYYAGGNKTACNLKLAKGMKIALEWSKVSCANCLSKRNA